MSENQTRTIGVRDARTHNLKGLSVEVPVGRLTAVVGLSGSGKTSLAFDTLYAEGQRRYAESFSAYARQFLARLERPDAEVLNVPPAVAIDRKPVVSTSRSTVGTLAQVLEPLRVLFATLATLHCDGCGQPVQPDDPAACARRVAALPAGSRVAIAFPFSATRDGWVDQSRELRAKGFLRAVVGDRVLPIEDVTAESSSGGVEIVVDRIRSDASVRRIQDSLEQAFREGKGRAAAHVLGDEDSHDVLRFSRALHCATCDRHYEPARPRTFSWNNPIGACGTCRGFGRTLEIDPALIVPDGRLTLARGAIKPWNTGSTEEERRALLSFCSRRKIPTDVPWRDLTEEQRRLVFSGDAKFDGVNGWFRWLETKTYKMHVRVLLSRYRTALPCPTCEGRRLKPDALRWRLGGKTIAEVTTLPVKDAVAFLDAIETAARPSGRDAAVVEACARELRGRLSALVETGLGYLDLDRPSRTLSGGELERVHLAAALGASLSETLFVLDEPSVGLHARDAGRLAKLLRALVDAGNTVVLVEHDPELVRIADHVIEVGPGAGSEGGTLTFEGSLAALAKSDGLTGQHLSGRRRIERPAAPSPALPRSAGEGERPSLTIKGARARTLRDVSATFPLGAITAVCGISGSGKSTLLEEVLAPSFRSIKAGGPPIDCDELEGVDDVTDVVLVDQGPVGRTPRANPLSYTRALEDVRERFAATDAARRSKIPAAWFSLNVSGGRCERCSGDGAERIEMQFLAPVFVKCEECQGRRFRDAVLLVTDRGKSIADVLEMSVKDGLAFYADSPAIVAKLAPLEAVGLGYLRLGQPLNTLSGGEAQRLKLAVHLQQVYETEGTKKRTKPLLLLLDEPTAGLHLEDVRTLLAALDRLAKAGHGIVVVEHHLDLIATADHVVELGPEGGPAGGEKVFEGSVDRLLRAKTATAEALRQRDRDRPTPRPLSLSREAGEGRGGGRADEHAILVKGAAEHNLKNVSVEVPRRKITVVTGLSGSGKSTLAFDVLFREGQRRYLDTLSPYARQFVARGERPDVESIVGVPPTVAIEQRTSRYGALSTVATVVELHPFLRVLYANAGTAHCPDCNVAIAPETEDSIAKRLVKSFGGSEAWLLAPVIRSRKGHHKPVLAKHAKQGKRFFEIDGKTIDLEDGVPDLERYAEHDVLVRVGEGSVPKDAARASALVREALQLGEGSFKVRAADGSSIWFSAARTCPECGRGFEPPDVRLFTWTARRGRCPGCAGSGISGGAWAIEADPDGDFEWADDAEVCQACHGTRLNELARSVRIGGLSLPDLCSRTVDELGTILDHLEKSVLDARGREVARPVLRGVRRRLEFLSDVGLGYLSLDRGADTLSGGEAQRLRLAAQLGAGLTGVLYVLDEPTIGLHARDSQKLVHALERLRDAGNTVVVVEHDERVIRSADHVLDMGPGAGKDGGRVVAQGSPEELARNPDSLTGRCLAGIETSAAALGRRRPIDGEALVLRRARARNLKNVDLRLPLGTLVAVSGISGSGKSTLVRDVLLPAVQEKLDRKRKASRRATSELHAGLEGAQLFARVAEVDQSPIGRTPRSVPATYVGMFDVLREMFAATTEARTQGFGKERFSFNSGDGRCAECDGQGRVRVEMAFLPTVETPCEGCGGARFDATTLEARLGGRSIADVLALTVREACEAFAHVPRLQRSLQLLDEVGLGYLQLGQPSTQLSGGEAQRVKLVRELSKKARGRTLYVLDEPTTGLHTADVARLVGALQKLVDRGDTVVVIEHNLEVIAASDLVYDLGPEGGAAGGELVAAGTPLEIVKKPGRSHTARLLREVVGRATAPPKKTAGRSARKRSRPAV